MPIHFHCSCGRAFAVPEEFAGTKARCSQCQTEIQVPTADRLEETEFHLTPVGGPLGRMEGQAKAQPQAQARAAAEPAEEEEFDLTPIGGPVSQPPMPAQRAAAPQPVQQPARPVRQPAQSVQQPARPSRPVAAPGLTILDDSAAGELLPAGPLAPSRSAPAPRSVVAPRSVAATPGPLDVDSPLGPPPAPGARRVRSRKQGSIDWGSPVTLSAIGGGGLMLILVVGGIWMATRPRGPAIAASTMATAPTAVSLAPMAPSVMPAATPPGVAPVAAPAIAPAVLPNIVPVAPQPPQQIPVPVQPAPNGPVDTPPPVDNPPPANPPQVGPPNGRPQPGPRQPGPNAPGPNAPGPNAPRGAGGDGDGEGEGDTESVGGRALLRVDPTALGLQVPPKGKVTSGGGRKVLLRDENNALVVGTVLAQVNDTHVVTLPTGRLTSAPEREVMPTDRPFEPVSRAELVSRLHTARFPKYKTATSEHYGYVYQCSPEFFETTRDILESMHDGVLEQLRAWELPAAEPTLPMVVLIFPDRRAFDEFEPMPAEVGAYYDTVQNHVVLYENPELSDAAPEYAMKKFSYIVAHEAIHQLLHNCGIQQRLAQWPQWVSEGLPEYFCPVRVTSSMVSKGGASLPARKIRWTKAGLVNDLRMRGLLRTRVSSGQLMQATTGSDDLNANGYAMAWGLTHYLATRKLEDFRAYLKKLSAIEPLTHLDPSQADVRSALFLEHFGANHRELEMDVAKHLNGSALQQAYRDPAVYQTHYVVVHNIVRGKQALIRVGITVSPAAAREWKERQELEFPSGNQSFRTEVCPTRKDAEILLTRLMRG